MRETRVLLTCIGGRFSRNTIQALKESIDPKIIVIGVDANPDVITKNDIESFYTVPRGSDRGYISELLRISKKEKVDIIIPCADEEVSALSYVFKSGREGIICAADKWENVSLTRDKWKLFEYLSKNSVSMPKYKLIKSAEDLKESSGYFGYPKKKFVLKPRRFRGARGVFIIGKDKESVALDKVLDLFEGSKMNSIAMEYLPGHAYDVDVLSKSGEPFCIMPRRRIWKNRLSPFSQGCIVEKHEELARFVEKIVRMLKLNYVYDFDCGTTEDGRPAIYEINPRFSGAIAASVGAGVNIPVMLIRMLLGMEVPKYNIRYGTRMNPKPDGQMEFTYEEKIVCK